MRCSTIYYNLFVLSRDVMVVISLELLLVVVTAAVPLTSIICVLVVRTVSFSITRRFTVTNTPHWEMRRREWRRRRCVLIDVSSYTLTMRDQEGKYLKLYHLIVSELN